MKKFLVYSLTLVLLTGLFGLSAAVAAKKGMRHDMRKGCAMEQGGEPMMHRLKMLGLDDAQMEDIMSIHMKARKETIRKKADLEVAQMEIREMLRKDAIDVNAVEARVKQLEAIKTDIKMTHIRALAEVKAKLTPEQRKKFNNFMMDMKGNCGMGGGGNCGMGKGGNCGDCGMMMDDDCCNGRGWKDGKHAPMRGRPDR